MERTPSITENSRSEKKAQWLQVKRHSRRCSKQDHSGACQVSRSGRSFKKTQEGATRSSRVESYRSIIGRSPSENLIKTATRIFGPTNNLIPFPSRLSRVEGSLSPAAGKPEPVVQKIRMEA